MIGLTPKSGFLSWMYEPTLGSGPVLPETKKRAPKSRCGNKFWNLSWTGIGGWKWKHKRNELNVPDVADAPITRSFAPKTEDWIVDMDAAECQVTNTLHPGPYMLKHIFTLSRKSNFLLLVQVSDDTALQGRKGFKVQDVQRRTS